MKILLKPSNEKNATAKALHSSQGPQKILTATEISLEKKSLKRMG